MIIVRKAKYLAKSMWARLNDAYLNIYTEDYKYRFSKAETDHGAWKGRPIAGATHSDNRAYVGINYYYLRRIISILNPGAEDVVYDIGSGLGRVVCLVARRNVRKCVGVELFPDMCVQAIHNAKSMRGRKAPIDIVCEDAAKASLGDGTIYFMFNPFGVDTMTDVIGNLRKGLALSPRPIRLVYYNPAHQDVLESCGWLDKYVMMRTTSGMGIYFYRNRMAVPAPELHGIERI